MRQTEHSSVSFLFITFGVIMQNVAKTAVIFDFNRTLFDPDTNALLPGARELLEKLRARAIPLFLISKRDEGRPQLLKELDLEGLFEDTLFVERKDPALFREIAHRVDANPINIYVIGDYLHKEIRSGNQAGMRTIWLKRGKFSELKPEIEADYPWKTIRELQEVHEIIE